MSRNYTGPRLPKSLLNQVDNGSNARRNRSLSRTDRRKAERQEKKQRPAKPPLPNRVPSNPPARSAKPLKSILKTQNKPDSPSYEEVLEEESDLENGSEDVTDPLVSRAVQEHLSVEDDEIAALEKKLGLKGKKTSKALEEDGLDWIAGGSDESDVEDGPTFKRKRPEDAKWLRDKRLKVSRVEKDAPTSREVDDNALARDPSSMSDDSDDNVENPFSDDEVGSEDFDGLDSEDGTAAVSPPREQRENPYVAPVPRGAADSGGKYVPPSLRKVAETDEEVLKQLRRQAQGLLNRLSESNMMAILGSMEELYEKNARQHVTSTLVDLLLGLVCDQSVLNDAFLVLHAGFSTALYKVVGTEFGAQLLEKTVESFAHYREHAASDGKRTVNLITFLSCLYSLQLIGSGMIFDYIRLLLTQLSENNTELLLRIIRTSGWQLRQDDPRSLKDIVALLNRSIAEVGRDQLSVRTKFMIETIDNLKNNRLRKTGETAAAAASEQLARMKKINGTLNSRQLKAREPLNITLKDLEDVEKKGKWWLVGASYRGENSGDKDHAGTAIAKDAELDSADDSEATGSVNYDRLARQQGMNTPVKRAIFVALLSSTDAKDAHFRILKLRLKAKQMFEIAPVTVHCVGGEETYNPYYALVARQFCGEHTTRKAFEFTLWDVLKSIEAAYDNDVSTTPTIKLSKIVNVAKFYGTMVVWKAQNLTMLKRIDFLALQEKTAIFVEVLLTWVFMQARRLHTDEFESNVKEVFTRVSPESVHGIKMFLGNSLVDTALAKKKKDVKAVTLGSRVAIQVLDELARNAHGEVSREDELDGVMSDD